MEEGSEGKSVFSPEERQTRQNGKDGQQNEPLRKLADSAREGESKHENGTAG